MSTTALPPLSPSEPPRVFGAPTLHTDGDLLALGVASDGTLWSVEEPGELRGWSLATRRLVSSRPLDDFATLWSFNWAARLLASAGGEVTVWEVASGEQLATWPTASWVTAVAFQPGTTLLATGHDDGSVRVWDWLASKLLVELEGHRSPVSALAFSLDGKHLATAGEGKFILLWGLPSGKKLGSLQGHKDRIPALAWHPDGRRLFSAGWDTTVRVWDITTREPVILLNSHATQVHALALSGDGRLLAAADSGNDVHLWDTERHQELAVIREAAGEVRSLAFTPNDGRGNLAPLLAFGSADRVIHLWDSRQGVGSGGADPLLSRTSVAVDPAGKRLFSLGGGTDLRAWDIATGEPALALEEEPLLRASALSPDGRWLAASRPEAEGSEDRATLALFDARTGKKVAGCDGQAAPITALAFRGDGRLLASGGVRSSDVWLWDVPSGEPVLLLDEAVEDCSVEAVAFHPDGRLVAVAGIDWLATSGQDGQVVLWDVEERQIKGSLHVALPTKEGPVSVSGGATALAFRPDGKVLACASLQRTIRLWDLASDSVEELDGHTDTVTCLAYSPDGKWLASGSDDKTLRVWDVADGELAGAWELDNAIKALAFSPDGKWLFTGNGNTSCYQIEVARVVAEE
jgi:WD40 repeat protein